MFYYIAQIGFFFIAPSQLFLFALSIGALLLFWRSAFKWGRRLVVVGAVGLLVCGFSPLGRVLIWPLEERFKAPVPLPQDGTVAGIIMLGGFENGRVSNARKMLALSDRSERLTETLRLAHKLPRAQIIFTGGAGSLFLHMEPAGNALAAYLVELGIPRNRIVVEQQSVNTWQNAVLTKKILKPRATDRYLLVTSAWHMPRSVGVFRKAGFNVIPYPVDYQTADVNDLVRPFRFFFSGLATVDIAAKQWIGLIVYYLTGRSSALFPGPER
jgi:uncharacterized SAM-binding protein YcdF (DUF218 family)